MPLRRFYIPLLVALSFFTFFLSPVIVPRYAYGLALSTNPITVTSRTYYVHFPNFIDIHASANDSIGTIDKASIVIDMSADGAQEIHTVPISKAGHAISVSWHEDTSGSHFIPPGTQVYYFWQFWDSAGNTLSDTSQQFSTIDTRFNWQHLTQGMLQVNWYNRAQDFGQTILSKASSSVQSISAKLGGGLVHPINLWVYETDQEFHGSLAPSSYEWVGGEALPSLYEASIVAAGTSDDTLVRDMPHELTHLIFHQLIAQGITAPTWFDEGLAVYNQIYQEPEMSARLQKALDSHTLLRLSLISGDFPADADQAYLAYAQSWNLVDYMYNTFGQPRMAQLIKLMNNSQADFDEDLQRALGVDQVHLENQWRLHLHQPAILTPDEMTPTPMPQPAVQVKQAQNVSTDYTTFWLLIGLAVALILVSLTCLILLVLYSVRHHKTVKELANAPTPANWQNGNKALPYPYPDPSTYMHTSMYARPSSQPASPYQGEEYPIKTPRKQAPQE
jgi:peptidase MA superfamily protein